MDIISALIILLIITIVILEVVIAIWFVTSKILKPYKRYTADLSMPELLTALNAVIENQITLYTKSIFEGGQKKIVSNVQFENYYRDLCNRILDDLSPEFFERMSFFMKKEAVVALVCRIVKDYLSSEVLK
jgi:hypothetical protein